jgi:hypothetical protein
MGDHKRGNKIQKRRWIICTKFTFKSESEETDPQCWVPFGQEPISTTTGVISDRVFNYESLEEAQKAFDEIVDLKEAVTSNLKDLTYSACEVRNIPSKLRAYGNDWHSIIVCNEVELKVKNPKRRSQEDIQP